MKHLEAISPEANPWAGVVFAAPPAGFLSEARRKYPNTVSLLFHLPLDTADYQAVFGTRKSISPIVTKELREAQDGLGRLGIGDPRRDVTSENFDTEVKSVPGAFVILVGHNENGEFVFVNGSRRGLADLANGCRAAQRFCIFVSCRSQEFLSASGAIGLKHEVSFNEGIYIARQLTAAIDSEATKELSATNVASKLRDIEKKAHFRFQTRYLILKGCGTAVGLMVIALVLYELDDCKGKAAPCLRH